MKNMNNCNKNMLARVNDGFNKNFAPTLFDFFSRPLADFDNMFTPMATDNARVDIKDLGDRYQLKADMPGVKKEDIKVDFENGDLTIRADHHKECNKKDEFGFMVHERSEGTYERSFHFEDVDPKDITAAYANGELDICLMKAKDAKTSTSIRIH